MYEIKQIKQKDYCENHIISYQRHVTIYKCQKPFMSQTINVFIRSRLDYADAFSYSQKKRIITMQPCISFIRWQLVKPQEKNCVKSYVSSLFNKTGGI